MRSLLFLVDQEFTDQTPQVSIYVELSMPECGEIPQEPPPSERQNNQQQSNVQ